MENQPQRAFVYDHGLGRIRSTWRDPIGKPLTDRRISALMKAGYYGKEFIIPGKICESPGCGRDTTRLVGYAYLPKKGYYCDVCLDRYREEHKQELELRRKIREAQRVEFDPSNWEGFK